jgi:hypothetical protein
MSHLKTVNATLVYPVACIKETTISRRRKPPLRDHRKCINSYRQDIQHWIQKRTVGNRRKLQMKDRENWWMNFMIFAM